MHTHWSLRRQMSFSFWFYFATILLLLFGVYCLMFDCGWALTYRWPLHHRFKYCTYSEGDMFSRGPTSVTWWPLSSWVSLPMFHSARLSTSQIPTIKNTNNNENQWALCYKIQKCEAQYTLRHKEERKKQSAGFAASYLNNP